MFKRQKSQSKGGFSLLEMTVVIMIMTIVASALVPSYINQYNTNTANKIALDMSAIQEASRAYYIANGKQWPPDIQTLQNNNFLPAGWKSINPFGNGVPFAQQGNYAYSITPLGQTLNVSTNVPTNAEPVVQAVLQNLLQLTQFAGNTVTSGISAPGALNALLPGSIIIWSSNSIPAGYLLCNGQTVSRITYSALFAAIGTTFGAGDGVSTFEVPDTMGRGVVGLNPLTTNDGSTRVWSTDSNDNLGGSFPYANVSIVGGVIGEERHRQNILELAPHSHTYLAPPPQVHGFSGESTTAPRGNDYNANTSTTGGNGDSTGLGAPANVVSPSMALNYIIKT